MDKMHQRKWAQINKRRRAARVTWPELADRAQVTPQTIKNWRAGRHEPLPILWQSFMSALAYFEAKAK